MNHVALHQGIQLRILDRVGDLRGDDFVYPLRRGGLVLGGYYQENVSVRQAAFLKLYHVSLRDSISENIVYCQVSN